MRILSTKYFLNVATIISLALAGLALVGCEGPFAGKRAENAELVNGPFQMKIQMISGVEYLVVLNTNYRFQAANGSLHFYSLSNSAQPVKATNLVSVSVPSNASDFEIVDGAVPSIYLLNRNSNEVWIYDLEGSAFSRRAGTDGEAIAIKAPENPGSILSYTRADVGLVFAITGQRSGIVGLLSKDSLTYLNPASLASPIASPDSTRLMGTDVYGSRFYMEARQTQVGVRDDRIGVSSSRRLGIGIIASKYLGDANETIVSINGLQNAFYSFQFLTFLNNSNFTWDLADWRSSFTLPSGVRRRGTGEDGFRGLDVDGNMNAYVSNRADNSIYKIPYVGGIDLAKTGTRNTTGFDRNVQGFRFPIDFDPDVTDIVYPRIGSLIVDPAPNADATLAWVVGLGEGVVYRVDLVGNTFIKQRVGEVPQRILGLENAGTYQQIYVANTKSDTITVLDPTTLGVVGEILSP